MRCSALILFLIASALSPDAAAACERCFGAGSNAPAVAAVSASMFALLVVISSVFVGVVGFFRNVHRRTAQLEDAEKHLPRNGRFGVPPFPAPATDEPDRTTASPDDPPSIH